MSPAVVLRICTTCRSVTSCWRPPMAESSACAGWLGPPPSRPKLLAALRWTQPERIRTDQELAELNQDSTVAG